MQKNVLSNFDRGTTFIDNNGIFFIINKKPIPIGIQHTGDLILFILN